jgi:glutamate 5-kinase
VLLSDVDGLYDAPPAASGSRRMPEVALGDDLAAVRVRGSGQAGVGTGGMRTKLEAARIATGAGIPVVLTSADKAAAALDGEPVGTWFHAATRRRPTRLLWLAHATEPKGVLHLDEGAVRAVTERRASLLAAGLTGCSGTFAAGDPVDLAGPDGGAVARGLVNFDSAELPDLAGRTSAVLRRELGAAYEREVVHRDDLVLLTHPLAHP